MELDNRSMAPVSEFGGQISHIGGAASAIGGHHTKNQRSDGMSNHGLGSFLDTETDLAFREAQRKKTIEKRRLRQPELKLNVVEICILPKDDEEEKDTKTKQVEEMMYKLAGGDIEHYGLQNPKKRQQVRNTNMTTKNAMKKSTLNQNIHKTSETNRFTRNVYTRQMTQLEADNQNQQSEVLRQGGTHQGKGPFMPKPMNPTTKKFTRDGHHSIYSDLGTESIPEQPDQEASDSETEEFNKLFAQQKKINQLNKTQKEMDKSRRQDTSPD